MVRTLAELKDNCLIITGSLRFIKKLAVPLAVLLLYTYILYRLVFSLRQFNSCNFPSRCIVIRYTLFVF